jgi:hypothetical protein
VDRKKREEIVSLPPGDSIVIGCRFLAFSAAFEFACEAVAVGHCRLFPYRFYPADGEIPIASSVEP